MKIRLARIDDAPAIADIYAPIVASTHTSFETSPPDGAEMGRRIGKVLGFHPWLVAERDGRVLGYAYASAHRERAAYQWSADVSCYVHADARGQGVGRQLYRKLLAVLAAQGHHAAFAGIALPNDASIRLHESVGFRRVGVYREVGYKAGGWRDTAWYQCILGEPPANPAPPRALHQLGLGVLDDP